MVGKYVTPKTISRHNQKTDTTAQLEKKSSSPHAVGITSLLFFKKVVKFG
jgi:hypothetical protein